MGIQMRDERQMKALTGLSQAQFDDSAARLQRHLRGHAAATL